MGHGAFQPSAFQPSAFQSHIETTVGSGARHAPQIFQPTQRLRYVAQINHKISFTILVSHDIRKPIRMFPITHEIKFTVRVPVLIKHIIQIPTKDIQKIIRLIRMTKIIRAIKAIRAIEDRNA